MSDNAVIGEPGDCRLVLRPLAEGDEAELRRIHATPEDCRHEPRYAQ